MPGFLYSESDYEPIVDAIDRTLASLKVPTLVTLAHSAGAKNAAIQLAAGGGTVAGSAALILIEPVDVDPPGGPHTSALEQWQYAPTPVA